MTCGVIDKDVLWVEVLDNNHLIENKFVLKLVQYDRCQVSLTKERLHELNTHGRQLNVWTDTSKAVSGVLGSRLWGRKLESKYCLIHFCWAKQLIEAIPCLLFIYLSDEAITLILKSPPFPFLSLIMWPLRTEHEN